jgi:type II secretory pathway predicted ATPase ExeA
MGAGMGIAINNTMYTVDTLETDITTHKLNSFFTGGNVGKNFSLLKHLYQCSKNILVILGEDGVGKSSFKTALLAEEQNTHNKFCCIAADSTITPTVLKQELSQSFNLDIDDEYGSHASNENLFVIIDDAHSLPTNTLKCVIDLSSANSEEHCMINLILFGKPILEQRLLSSQIAAPKDKVSVLELDPLSLQETAEYLVFKWSNENNTDSFPFSKKQIKKIYQLSKGNPKQIEQAAKHLLYGHKANTPLSSTKKSLTPIILGFVITLGIFFVFLAYLMQPAEGDRSDIIQSNEFISPIENQQLEELQVKLEKEQKLRKELEKWILEQDKTIETLKQQGQELQNAVDLANLQKVEIEDLQKRMSPKTNQQANNPSHQEQELLKLNPNHFILQLVGLSQESAVLKFIKSNNLEGQAFYYRTSLKNKPWYVVVYGNYASQALANDAIQNLPDKLRQLHPYPHKIAAIQKSINTNLQR